LKLFLDFFFFQSGALSGCCEAKSISKIVIKSIKLAFFILWLFIFKAELCLDVAQQKLDLFFKPLKKKNDPIFP
jgi:hypothetical protein